LLGSRRRLVGEITSTASTGARAHQELPVDKFVPAAQFQQAAKGA
jgi:hypothetical protein